MLNDRINEEISLGVLWRMATRFSSANKRALHTHTRTHRGETSDSLYPILSCRSFHAWDYTRWYKKSGSSRRSWCLDILNFMTCNNTIEPVDHSPSFLLHEKNPPFFLRTPFSLPLPSFLSFFSSHSASSPRSKEVFKEKKEKRTCVPQEVNQS